MILDANLLLYARNSADPRHERASEVVEKALNGARRVGLPWQTLTAFLRISTHPRVFPAPLSADAAAQQVKEWLAAPAAWVPVPTPRHDEVLLPLLRGLRITGPLVSDAHLAALALEHGVAIWSTDADFARFDGLAWHDPLR
ncbi:MAG TPA: TA system VapC family ribonuclease toxin [Mycobacteriales bacterium]|nr:TA system VapC family ribonuclease toxin [Mycobacteriales bacterium]